MNVYQIMWQTLELFMRDAIVLAKEKDAKIIAEAYESIQIAMAMIATRSVDKYMEEVKE